VSPSPGRVLVTGANGFVGRPLCRHLVRAGWTVRAAVRRREAVDLLPAGVEPHLLAGDAPWDAAVAGVERVVHLISRAAHRHGRDRARRLAADVEGTRRLGLSCLRAGVRRLVYVSSIKAVGEGAGSPYDERSPCRPRDAYGRAKLEAERLVQGLPGPLETVVVRPPLVYGPGVKGNLLRLLRLVALPVPLPLSRVDNRRSLVHVDNLAGALACCLEHPGAAGAVWHVADEPPLSTPDLIRRLAAALGRRPLLVPAPPRLLDAAGRLLGREEEAARLLGSLVVVSDRIREQLRWRPDKELDAGLAELGAWHLAVCGKTAHTSPSTLPGRAR